MSEKKRVNKLHPDYDAYIKKCKDIQHRMGEETSKCKYQGGMDGPLGDIHKKYINELVMLQEEYAYLFTEE